MAPNGGYALLGRGGAEHKYLQHLVKRLAEDRGYRATIEQPILGGAGSVDVALERDGQKLACEISVTTSGEQQLGNVQKCLAAGYDEVVLLSADKRALRALERLVSETIRPGGRAKVRCLSPEEFVGYLDDREATTASRVETVRGYKVKVGFRRLGQADEAARRQAIAQVLVKGRKRVRQPSSPGTGNREGHEN